MRPQHAPAVHEQIITDHRHDPAPALRAIVDLVLKVMQDRPR